MNNELIKTFENSDFGKIRVTVIDGKPMLCLADVCRVLELKNPAMVKTRLKEAGITTIYIGVVTGKKADGSDAVQKVPMLFIDEPNFYRAVFQSRRPEATIISDWVVEEVLPTIMKTGSYSLQPQNNYMLQAPKTYAEALRALADETERSEALQVANKSLESQVVFKDQQIAIMQPKASYYDVILNSPELLSTTSIAKDFGWSAYQLNKYLSNLGIQYKKGNRWYLYQKYADYNYTGPKSHAFPSVDGVIGSATHMYWTQKGRSFIYETLKAHGILPTMERPKQIALEEFDFGQYWS